MDRHDSAAGGLILSGPLRATPARVEIPDGLLFARESIEACLPFAKQCGIKLVIENHYKDDFWLYPEFVQKMELFVQLVDSIQDPDFGVNYDPSNAFLAGEDPLVLLRRVSKRVMTMHASDRYLMGVWRTCEVRIRDPGLCILP